MEDHREVPEVEPKIETSEGPQEKNFTNKQLVVGVIVILVLCIGAYFITEFPNQNCEQVRNDSYNLGTQDGVLYWNQVVIQTINENSEIPYIVNNTLESTSIAQMCGGVQND